MEISKDEIENILRSTPKNQEVIDFLCLQELVIVVDILYEILSKNNENDKINDNLSQWKQRVSQPILKELKDAQSFFGLKDFANRLDLTGFLDIFYNLYIKR